MNTRPRLRKGGGIASSSFILFFYLYWYSYIRYVVYLVCDSASEFGAMGSTSFFEAIEALLYGCSTWTLRQEDYAKLRTVHHRVLLRIIGAQRKRPDHRMISYNRALEITGCESIETTLRTRKLLKFVGGDAPPNERRAVAKANHVRKP